MTLTKREVCICHLYNVDPMIMLRFTSHWDLVSALEFYMSMSIGNQQERDAADSLTVSDVYEAIQIFLDGGNKRGVDEDVMGAYCMDPDLYSKILFMATHGWQNEKGESYL